MQPVDHWETPHLIGFIRVRDIDMKTDIRLRRRAVKPVLDKMRRTDLQGDPLPRRGISGKGETESETTSQYSPENLFSNVERHTLLHLAHHRNRSMTDGLTSAYLLTTRAWPSL